MRGLKFTTVIVNAVRREVALYTSAWIEISKTFISRPYVAVALYTSAWIEILALNQEAVFSQVALYTSAWIEIKDWAWTQKPPWSRTLHECVD